MTCVQCAGKAAEGRRWYRVRRQCMDHCADPQGVLIMSPEHIDALSRSLADSTSRRSLLQVLGVGVAGTAVAGTALTGIGLREAQAKTFTTLQGIPIVDKDGDKRFRGTLNVQSFQQQGNEIVAIARLKGTLRKGDKGKKRISRTLRVP